MAAACNTNGLPHLWQTFACLQVQACSTAQSYKKASPAHAPAKLSAMWARWSAGSERAFWDRIARKRHMPEVSPTCRCEAKGWAADLPQPFTCCAACAADLRWLVNHLGTVYNSLERDVAKDQFIKFGRSRLHRVIPLALYSPIYVRPLYWKLLDKLEAADIYDASIVTGNPGKVERELMKWNCKQRQ